MILSALNEGISIRMIAQGSDEINIIVGVHKDDFERAIRAIYRAFSDGDHLLELKDLKKAQEDARPHVLETVEA